MKSQNLDLILSHLISPTFTDVLQVSYILILFSCLSNDLCHLDFPAKILYEFVVFLIRATYPTHIVLCDLIILAVFWRTL